MLLAASSGHAQSPSSAPLPLPGFVPPYEIAKIVRSAGFSPLAPPRREGATYVLRATDFRGILMRVVVDARSGAIRAVNRIVPPGPYGALMAGPYGPPPYGAPPPYGMLPPYGPPDVVGPEMGPDDADLGPPMRPRPGVRSSMYPPGAEAPAAGAPPPAAPSGPPLPRPRPAELTSRGETLPAAKPGGPPAARPDAASASAPPPHAPPAPAAPRKPSAPIPD